MAASWAPFIGKCGMGAISFFASGESCRLRMLDIEKLVYPEFFVVVGESLLLILLLLFVSGVRGGLSREFSVALIWFSSLLLEQFNKLLLRWQCSWLLNRWALWFWSDCIADGDKFAFVEVNSDAARFEAWCDDCGEWCLSSWRCGKLRGDSSSELFPLGSGLDTTSMSTSISASWEDILLKLNFISFSRKEKIFSRWVSLFIVFHWIVTVFSLKSLEIILIQRFIPPNINLLYKITSLFQIHNQFELLKYISAFSRIIQGIFLCVFPLSSTFNRKMRNQNHRESQIQM